MENNQLNNSEIKAFEVVKQCVFVNYNYKQTITDIKEELRCSLLEAKESLDSLLLKGYVGISVSSKRIVLV